MPLGNDANCKSLLHLDGAFGSTTFTDSNAGGTAKSWSATGAPILAAGKVGSGCSAHWSNLGNGWISTPTGADFNLGTNNFTIELWFRTTSSARQVIASQWGATVSDISFWVEISGSTTGQIDTGLYSGSTLVCQLFSTTNTYNDGNWHHWALVRNGTNFTQYIDGVVNGSATSSASINSSTQPLVIGAHAINSDLGVIGYIDEFRFSNGTARYTAPFTPSTTPFVSDSFTKSLLHFDADTYIDSATGGAAHTWTAQTYAMTINPKFGSACLALDGASYISTPTTADFNLGTGNFTIELWFRARGTSRQWLASQWGSTVPDIFFGMEVQASTGTIGTWCYGGSVQIAGIQSTTVVNDGNWHHLAFVRNGTTFTQYIDGVSQGTATSSAAVNSSTQPLVLGEYAVGATYGLIGCIDEFRFSNVARWTANFTPPTDPYFVLYTLTATNLAPSSPVLGSTALGLPALTVNDGNTMLLLHGDGSTDKTFTDATGRHVVTPDRGVAVSAAQKKFGASAAAFGPGRLILDGSQDFAFGTGDFTIDFWVYLTPTSVSQSAIYDGDQGVPSPYIYLNNPGSGSATLGLWVNGGAVNITSSTTLALNTWYHVAVVRASSTTKIYLNGTQVGSAADSQTYQTPASLRPVIGDYASLSPGTNAFSGYLDELRVSKGLARWTANFTPPVAAYTPDANTVLLLHFEDAITTTTSFPDSSGRNHVVSPSGNAKTVGSPAQFGGAAMAFDGSANTYLGLDGSSDFAFGTGNFSIDFWFRMTSVQTTGLYDARNSGSSTPCIFVNSNVLSYYIGAAGTTVISGTTVLGANTWYHAALVRAAGVTTLYLNGTQEGPSYNDATNYVSGSVSPVIGAVFNGSSPLNGYMDEVRVSRVARWTTNFTPPTAPYPPYQFTAQPLAPASPYLGPAWPIQYIDATTVLLVHCDGVNNSTAISDTSGRNHPVTPNGNAKLTTTQKQFGSASVILDGALSLATGSYLKIDGSSDFAFGTGDFTIDCWTYFTSLAVSSAIFDIRDNANPVTNPGFALIVNTSPGSTGVAPNLAIYNSATAVWSYGSTLIALNAWNHIAVIRTAGVTKVYLNGVLEISVADTSNYGALGLPANWPLFGQGVGGGTGFNGSLDEIRVSKAAARWTGNFNPPLAPYGYFFAPSPTLATASPSLGTPLISSGLGAYDLVPASPVLGTPAMTHFFALVPLGLTTASPVLDLAYQVGVLTAINLVTGSPVVPLDPILHGTQFLGDAIDLETGSPEIGQPNRIPPRPPNYPPDMDRHIRRSGDDYARALIDLLPRGQAWPRDPGTTLIRSLTGLAEYWGFVDGRAADLLERESDPRSTLELLPDWERNFGLPDECFPPTLTIGQRQEMLVLKMTLIGGQSRSFFIYIAEWLGYTITISEYAPFMAGVSRVGDTRTPPVDPNPFVGDYRWYIGGPEMRFYWTVHVGRGSLVWFRASKGRAGVDPHLRIGLALDLECLLRRWKPAHTDIVFDYSDFRRGGPMEGTP